MEMESTRRPSFDRSRELKKPRLAAVEAQPKPNARPFPLRPPPPPPPPAAGGAPPASARYRAGNDRVLEGSKDSSQTEAYQPQPQPRTQTYHELVSQYKTALAELTFNSKPIITNLTIIAGENLPAAKAIVATVCTNILEVPSEQKLPSLYLLDSIVKNIGRDYIRYFAARLPEVFCKAYRQVDPSVHPSMRHLFGTWKGVFPPQTLQMIEKELSFASALNGSGAATSRLDSQSQRPQHSIHVNPKYLERQRLQQSSGRAKGGVGDEPSPVPNFIEDTERLDRASVIETGRTWVDSSAKLHMSENIPRLHREVPNEPLHDKKISAVYGDLEYGSSVSRNSSRGIGRMGRTVAEPGRGRLWCGAGSGITETALGQRNGFTIKHGLSNYPTPRSSDVDVQLQPVSSITSRSIGGMSSSWKNSEEEEFMWDMHSRLSEQDAAKVSSSKDHWTPDDSERVDFDDHLPKARSLLDTGSRFDGDTSSDSLSTEQKETTFGLSSPYRLQELQASDKLIDSGMGHAEGYSSSLGGLTISADSSLTIMGHRPSLGSHHVGSTGFGLSASALSGSKGTMVPQRFLPASILSPTGQSLIRQRPPSPSFPASYPQQLLQHATEQNYPQTRSFPPLDYKLPKISGNLLPVNFQLAKVQKMQPRDLPESSPSGPTFQLSQKYPLSKAPQSISEESEHVDQPQNGHLNPVSTSMAPSMFETSTPEHSNPPTAEISGQSSTSNLLAAVMESGILAKLKTDGLPNQSFHDVGQATASASTEPPLPSVPPSSIVTSSMPKVKSASLSTPLLHDDTSVISDASQRTDKPPPVPPGPSTKSAQTADVTSSPISSLLSSLVAKGLISSSKVDTSNLLTPQTPSQQENQKPRIISSNTTAVSSVPILSAPLGIVDKVSPTGFDAKTSDILLQHSSVMADSLIGLEFKPDVLRESHPPVIDAVYNDLPQQCNICGLRLKIKQQLDRHLEWHALKKVGSDGENKVTRRWYADSKDWVAGKAGVPLCVLLSECLEDHGRMMDGDEPMVLADEYQCICVLCGELFDDYYCQDKKAWLFRGAVHMTVPQEDAVIRSTYDSRKGPIVHASCLSESPDIDLGIQTDVQLEKDA